MAKSLKSQKKILLLISLKFGTTLLRNCGSFVYFAPKNLFLAGRRPFRVTFKTDDDETVLAGSSGNGDEQALSPGTPITS